MKPTKLKSAREVMEALLRGESVTCWQYADQDKHDLCMKIDDNGNLCVLRDSGVYRCESVINFRCDWEIYREPAKPCGFVEAMQKVYNGDPMKRNGRRWFVALENGKTLEVDEIDRTSKEYIPLLGDIIGTDWLPAEGDEG